MINIELISPIKEAQTSVRTVNGKSGDVFLTAKDVQALPESTYIPSIAGLATEEYVEQRVREVQLGDEVDLDEYATKKYVDNMILEAEESGMLSNYYTKDEVEVKYKAHVKEEIDKVEHYVDEKVANVSVDLTGYATEEYVNKAIGNIDIPEVDFTGYATEKYVDDKNSALAREFTVALEETANEIGMAINITYAKKADIPDVSGFQTADDVNAAITSALGAIGVAEEGEY